MMYESTTPLCDDPTQRIGPQLAQGDDLNLREQLLKPWSAARARRSGHSSGRSDNPGSRGDEKHATSEKPVRHEVDAVVTEARPYHPIGGATVAQAGCILVNGRFRVHKTTGMQRYANELTSRFGGRVRVIEPKEKLRGVKGHAWEQFALPRLVGANLLWSPCNTGPCWFRQQVVTIHDMFPLDYPEWFSRAFVRGFNIIVPRLIRRARRVIAVSEYTKTRILETTGVPAEKITVIHSGVGRQFRPQRPEAVAEARRAVGIGEGPYLLSVSSLEPRKNVKRILEAWDRALPHIPEDCRLLFVGGLGSNTVFAALNLSRIPDRVVFPGYIEDRHLPALYADARAFIFPSLAEGFGFPPLEAMACGAPVLTSNNSSLIEIAGPAAVLVDPEDVGQIARGIRDLAIDPGLGWSLRERGFDRAGRFRWEVAADRTWALLESEQDALNTTYGAYR